jgi:DNA modification methylase
MGLYTSYTGDNGDLIREVADFYLRPGMRVADVTWGRGVFWRKVDLTQYDFHPSDIRTHENKFDFRSLPYGADSFDAVVLDPPYAHDPGRLAVNDKYQNSQTTKGMNHSDIIQLYRGGMQEGFRILKTDGQLWVKCKDEIDSHYQRWSHVEIFLMALQLGFFGKDLFIFTQTQKPMIQQKIQQHARKNHSYLWVFKKPNKSQEKALTTYQLTAPFIQDLLEI